MRCVCTIGLLLLAFTASAQSPGSKAASAATTNTAGRITGKIPDIESIAVLGPPMIFGGYSFYADHKGQLVHQSVEPDTERKHGYFIEERLVLRHHGELFNRLVEQLNPTDLLTYREGRGGFPDELRLRFEITLSNGNTIIAKKWANDKVPALDELLERIQSAIQAMRKIQPPTRIPYDDKDFGAHSRILKAG